MTRVGGAMFRDMVTPDLPTPDAALTEGRPVKARVDGLPKVTGSKFYATDLRPADLPGWPSTCSHAWLLRAPYADRPFEGVDGDAIATLDLNLRPEKVI